MDTSENHENMRIPTADIVFLLKIHDQFVQCNMPIKIQSACDKGKHRNNLEIQPINEFCTVGNVYLVIDVMN